MVELKTNKIPAFSLFESVVAISIVSVLIFIGSMIYGNLISSEKPVAYYKGQEEIYRLQSSLHTQEHLVSTHYTFEEFEIDQRVKTSDHHPFLKEVSFDLLIGGKVKWTSNQLIAVYE